MSPLLSSLTPVFCGEIVNSFKTMLWTLTFFSFMSGNGIVWTVFVMWSIRESTTLSIPAWETRIWAPGLKTNRVYFKHYSSILQALFKHSSNNWPLSFDEEAQSPKEQEKWMEVHTWSLLETPTFYINQFKVLQCSARTLYHRPLSVSVVNPEQTFISRVKLTQTCHGSVAMRFNEGVPTLSHPVRQ